MRKSRLTEGRVVASLGERGRGGAVAGACRRHGVGDAAPCEWEARFGGMAVSDAREPRGLQGGLGRRAAARDGRPDAGRRRLRRTGLGEALGEAPTARTARRSGPTAGPRRSSATTGPSPRAARSCAGRARPRSPGTPSPSCDGRLRDEGRGGEAFDAPAPARRVLARWRHDRDRQRPRPSARAGRPPRGRGGRPRSPARRPRARARTCAPGVATGCRGQGLPFRTERVEGRWSVGSGGFHA